MGSQRRFGLFPRFLAISQLFIPELLLAELVTRGFLLSPSLDIACTLWPRPHQHVHMALGSCPILVVKRVAPLYLLRLGAIHFARCCCPQPEFLFVILVKHLCHGGAGTASLGLVGECEARRLFVGSDAVAAGLATLVKAEAFSCPH